jgi:hypothetical protein
MRAAIGGTRVGEPLQWDRAPVRVTRRRALNGVPLKVIAFTVHSTSNPWGFEDPCRHRNLLILIAPCALRLST